jgi:hypothetical protein
VFFRLSSFATTHSIVSPSCSARVEFAIVVVVHRVNVAATTIHRTLRRQGSRNGIPAKGNTEQNEVAVKAVALTCVRVLVAHGLVAHVGSESQGGQHKERSEENQGEGDPARGGAVVCRTAASRHNGEGHTTQRGAYNGHRRRPHHHLIGRDTGHAHV